jgi:5-methyltetrahydrofolate--homocysteine methyltransferase
MDIRDRIKSGIFYFDGATGSVLQEWGIRPGELPETWNIIHPDKIAALGRSYFEAGANAVSANTFGANSLKYDGKDGRYALKDIVSRGMECAFEARRTAKSDLVQKDLYVGADIGSLGKLLKPLGDMEFERAVELFSETISIAAKCGAEYILIETMNDIYEAKAAVLAAHECCDLPVFVSNVFDESGRTMTGSSPLVTTTVLTGLGVEALGANCSLGPDQMLKVLPELYKNSSVPVIFMPNAGLPVTRDGKTCYDIDAVTFGNLAAEAVKKGARLLGGCCGTTPEHIKQMVLKTRDLALLPVIKEIPGLITSGSVCVSFGERPILIGERINPTGKKKLKEALRASDMSYILNEAVTQEDAGADVLDVNVGLPELDEKEMLVSVTKELQAVTTLPLQLDTSDPVAMEAALRIYNGKAMINSVNGKQEVMDAVFPLVKKYGGLVVCLTLDESGIPETAEGRFAIAEKMVKRAEEYGISRKDLIFDPLAMAVSSDNKAGRVTIDTIKLIKNRLGCLTSLGVSNVSFGLPERMLITSVFFAMAMEAGLDAAIMNPFSTDMMKSFKCFLTLSGKDENCLGYIDFVGSLPTLVENTAAKTTEATNVTSNSNAEKNEVSASEKTGVTNASPLYNAIIRGLSEKAAAETKALIGACDTMEIVNDHIIPALNEVGEGFEKKKLYLPQLLMSAEAAKAAFSVVSENMPEQTAKGPKVIMATVKGDIHDIGKNIVVALLKNYGFDVIDLGKDVEISAVTDAVVKYDVHLVGLSALMTTTVPAMADTIKAIRELGRDVKVCVGGAVLTEEYAKMINADKYAANAMETVRYAKEVLQGE